MGCRSENWIDVGCFATDANRGNGKGYYFLAKNAQKVDQTAVSDDLEEQELLILSASELQEALDRNRVKIINWQAAFAMALLH